MVFYHKIYWPKKCIWYFQDDSQLIEKWQIESRFQYVISITFLIDLKYILTAITRCVQIEFEWMIRDERQFKNRINRINQKEQTCAPSGPDSKNYYAMLRELQATTPNMKEPSVR